jgi:PAS domain S-box-containing protein
MWFSVSVYSPRKKYFVAVFDVITERKQMENRLRESEKKYRELFMQMENGAATHKIILDVHGNAIDYITLDVNDAYESFLGVKKYAVVGKKASEILPPEELQKWVGIFGPVALTGIPTRYEMYSPLNQRYFEGSAYCMERGKFAVTFSDITERKLADEKLARSQKLLQDITDNSTNLIYALDQQGKFLLINRRLEAVFGVPREKMIGKTREGVMPSEIAAAHRANDQQVLAQGRPMEYDEVNEERDGSHTYLSIKFPLFDAGGRVYGIGGISTDISERKQAEQQIRQLNVTLEQRVEDRTNELSQAQEQLLRKEKLAVLGQLAGSVSHELRNPLGVISNSVYYLKLVQPEANDKIGNHLAIIEEQTHIAAKIIGDLLDYARVSTAERGPVSIGGIVKKTLERFPVPAGVELRLELPEDLPEGYADALHIEQVLGNLVMNACQAMANGGTLVISAQRSELRAGQPSVSIQVRDTGTGIRPEDMQKVFEPLFSTKAQGIGLGLAVSQKLALANGGRIEVASELGQGSTFTVFIPVGDRGE